ncbi:hypothetical protein DID88_006876 [Monilinia fructigena]|uniref:Flavoprotein domain-containing protein n=1 Tax=Monilinia fructigena TaxID=38457 RepID=A0A395IG94_9HELO|nr:hypothetical protein DID88_006876 [Monilinia fructigena]
MLQMIHSEHDVHLARVSGTSHPFTAEAHASDGQSAEQPHIDTFHRHANVQGVFWTKKNGFTPGDVVKSILHIELRRWAHMLVIAPLSANTMAKITGGFSDNLLTSVVRAWDTNGELDATGQNSPDTNEKKAFSVKEEDYCGPSDEHCYVETSNYEEPD